MVVLEVGVALLLELLLVVIGVFVVLGVVAVPMFQLLLNSYSTSNASIRCMEYTYSMCKWQKQRQYQHQYLNSLYYHKICWQGPCWYGVDVDTEGIVDTLKSGVWEPTMNKVKLLIFLVAVVVTALALGVVSSASPVVVVKFVVVIVVVV